MEKFYELELNKIKDVAKQEIHTLKALIENYEREVETQRSSNTKYSQDASTKLLEYDREVKKLVKELDALKLENRKLEQDIKNKDYQNE